MDATGFFFDLLANFFPLLGSVILIGILAIVGITVVGFCMMILVAVLSELLN